MINLAPVICLLAKCNRVFLPPGELQQQSHPGSLTHQKCKPNQEEEEKG